LTAEIEVGVVILDKSSIYSFSIWKIRPAG